MGTEPNTFARINSFQNPVYDRSFPDPFVIRHRGEYIAFCTGHADDGRIFGRLHSTDLVHWQPLAGAMVPLDSPAPFYWAPEVNYHNGTFYLYYSVGNETLMEIRLATASRLDGEFRDAGVRLTFEEFAIDPHVFRDTDGSWYMFYATDFLEHTHIGTGTVIDRMIDPMTLAGRPRPVTRARYDWQIYDANRVEKGGVRWHTVEGSFVLKRKGLYYEMFSGGNWQNVSYGVSFAVTDDILRDDEWAQYSDGTRTLPILKTIPDMVIGPGHNSVVRSPNGRELYCVYHRWTENGRVLAIDRMEFAGGGRMFIIGPTTTPQPAPHRPTIAACEASGLQTTAGEWCNTGTDLSAMTDARNETELWRGFPAYLIDTYVTVPAGGECGLFLESIDRTPLMQIAFSEGRTAHVTSGGVESKLLLKDEIDAGTYFHIRLDVDHRSVALTVNDTEAGRWLLPSPAAVAAVFSAGAGAAFSALHLTVGFEELFDDGRLETRDWRLAGTAAGLEPTNGTLALGAAPGETAHLSRPIPPGDIEISINLAVADSFSDAAYVAVSLGQARVEISPTGGVWGVRVGDVPLGVAEKFDPAVFRQFRLVLIDSLLTIYRDEHMLGQIPATDPGRDLSISAIECTALLDMVRCTQV